MKFLRALFLLLVVLVLLGAVVAFTLPARIAYQWAAPRLGPVRLEGIDGSVWDGSADSLSVFNQPLGAIQWQLARWPLLSRRVEADVALSGGAVQAKGHVVRDALGELHANAVEFQFPATLAEPAVDIPALKLQGEIVGRLEEATLRGGWVAGAHGAARWQHAGVSGQAEARFGDLLIDFASQPDGSIAGTVKDDQSSNLAVNGQFVVHAGEFDAQAVLTARNEDMNVREALQYIGQPQPDGSSLLKIHGQLYKLF
jgi:hypothetical protein